jgi:phage-related protein
MLVNWTITFHSQRVEHEILALPPGLLARFLRYAERMEAYGPDLGMPHTRAMGGGLFELRLKAAEGIATPPRELDIARRRMNEVKHG